ncbi:hypothetical protein [Nitrosomonas communis]|uniref:hypothetical protein n=1 Tax=Nitrosomonas communis TaxID=44574 RepID=UPI0011153718|nr:hypothetical protein [Nitrosomonas communis]
MVLLFPSPIRVLCTSVMTRLQICAASVLPACIALASRLQAAHRLQVATYHPCQFVCIEVLMDSFMVDEQFTF